MANNGSNTAIREYIIPTYVHIVVSDDGTKSGDVSRETIDAQIKALNEAYATNAARSGVRWVFQVQSVERVVGPDMCDQGNEKQMKAKLRRGGRGALNLFVTDLSACGLLGYSSWPWDLAKKGVTMDGVVIHYDTLPGGQYKPYNLGRTGIHEIGHWLGLYHTFQVCCCWGGGLVDLHPHHYHHHAHRSTPPPQRTHTRHRMAALATGTPYRTRPTVPAPARAALFTATHAPSLGRTLCAISWTTAMTPACVPFLLANMVAWRQCGSSTVSRHETGDQRPEERLLLSVGCFCLCVCPSATLQLQL